MKNQTEWFSHDANARHDPKMAILINDHGPVAYAWYFMLVEKLRQQESYTLPLPVRLYAYELHADAEQLEGMFSSACAVGLFSLDDTCFWTDGLLQRMARMEEISEKRREAIKSRWSRTNQHRVGKQRRSTSKDIPSKKVIITSTLNKNIRDKNRIDNIVICNSTEQQKNYKCISRELQDVAVWKDCTFFRMGEHELELVRGWFAAHHIDIIHLEHIIQVVENWMALGRSKKAIQARNSRGSHHLYLYQPWAISEGMKLAGALCPTPQRGKISGWQQLRQTLVDEEEASS